MIGKEVRMELVINIFKTIFKMIIGILQGSINVMLFLLKAFLVMFNLVARIVLVFIKGSSI